MRDKCQKCPSTRIMYVNGKTDDRCHLSCDGLDHHDYVMSNIGIGGGDYIKFSYCLDCGQIQGAFPVKGPHLCPRWIQPGAKVIYCGMHSDNVPQEAIIEQVFQVDDDGHWTVYLTGEYDEIPIEELKAIEE